MNIVELCDRAWWNYTGPSEDPRQNFTDGFKLGFEEYVKEKEKYTRDMSSPSYLETIVSTARRELGQDQPDLGTLDYDVAVARTAVITEQIRVRKEILCRVDPEWKASIEDVLDIVCPYSY